MAVGLAALVALPTAARPTDVTPTPTGVTEAPTIVDQNDPDAVIVAQIQGQLAQERDLRRVIVGVSSRDGHVVLAGSAPNSIALDRAVQIARATPGVFRVDNFIRLDISSPEAPTRN
jgi:osmotically-inducible protein OsmY